LPKELPSFVSDWRRHAIIGTIAWQSADQRQTPGYKKIVTLSNLTFTNVSNAMEKLFQPLLFFYLAVRTERELRRQIESFKAENEMLRERVPKQRIFLTRDERERLVCDAQQGGFRRH
jgi:hypothetical protein